VRLAYEWHGDSGQWFRSYGNENWEFNRARADGAALREHQWPADPRGRPAAPLAARPPARRTPGGSANGLARHIEAMSNGRIKIQVFCAGGICPALERSLIDTAEFVGPFLDRRLGLQNAEQYCCTTRWHQSATVWAPLVNAAPCDRLPADLKAIVENACAARNVISEA
jgi:TRAP-type mannitol/chloroaromatic compound transport system substrate-binding protein